MERRRLRLHGTRPLTPGPGEHAAPSRRVPAPGRCLSVSDTEQGDLATLWALDLLQAFAAEGRPVGVIFTSFEHAPELSRERMDRALAEASVVRTWSVSREPDTFQDLLGQLPEGLTSAPAWLLVGAPALLAFEPYLGVLVTGDRGPERWPPGLRALRPGLALEVADLRPSLARALARALLTTT